jgi:hypothetical protein
MQVQLHQTIPIIFKLIEALSYITDPTQCPAESRVTVMTSVCGCSHIKMIKTEQLKHLFVDKI